MPPVKRRGIQKPKNTKQALKRLFSYMTSYKALWVVVVLCVILDAGANIAGTYLLKPALNNYVVPFIAQKDVDMTPFALLLGLMATIYIVGALASYLNNRIMLLISTRTLYKIRTDLFSHMETLPLSYYDKKTHGELMSLYTNDVDTLRDMLSQSVPRLLNSVLTVSGVLTMMIILSPVLCALVVVFVALIILSIKFVGKQSAASYRENQKNIAAVNGYIEELITGQKVVKVFTHENKARADFAVLNANLRKAGTRANTWGTVMGPLTNNMGHIQYAVTAIFGAYLVIKGSLSIGTIASFLQYTRNFNRPINETSQLFNGILNALAGAERIFSAIDEKSEIDEGSVKLVNVRKAHSEQFFSTNSAETSFPDNFTRATSPKTTDFDLSTRVNSSETSFPDNLTRATSPKTTISDLSTSVNCSETPFPDNSSARDSSEMTFPENLSREKEQIQEVSEQTGLWAWKSDGLQLLHGDVNIENVSFSYRAEKEILHGISLFAKSGQKIALVGSTGSGKTTITNLLTRFYDVDEGKGRITYDGIALKDIKKDDLRRSLGMVLQDTHLFTGTVRDNIRYGRLEASDEQIIAAAKLANAHGFIKHLPQGYDTVLTSDGANLSAGQRQLLAIARAAVADPPVLILDEATSSIDTRTEALIEKGMDSLMQGRTVFVIAHRLSTVRNADCIIVLEKGTIIERGTHEELLEKRGRYYQLYTGAFELS